MDMMRGLFGWFCALSFRYGVGGPDPSHSNFHDKSREILLTGLRSSMGRGTCLLYCFVVNMDAWNEDNYLINTIFSSK